jgi:hypothetical protein
MFQKSCEGCGRRFEAQKASRRWCSDVCGRRTRRQNARAFSPVIAPSLTGRTPVISADSSDADPDSVLAETLRENIAFARFVIPDLTVDLDFVAGLSDPADPGWVSGCSESVPGWSGSFKSWSRSSRRWLRMRARAAWIRPRWRPIWRDCRSFSVTSSRTGSLGAWRPRSATPRWSADPLNELLGVEKRPGSLVGLSALTSCQLQS